MSYTHYYISHEVPSPVGTDLLSLVGFVVWVFLPQSFSHLFWKVVAVTHHELQHVLVCICDDKLVLECMDHCSNGKVLWHVVVGVVD